ncbi:hypothetical protein H310_02011 [Aphanomyces invadans]|uniref:Uncharacterized protein n=1 Tax=Aphanomyces invadans TaxID=157072 RepID=A0A024UMW8_9STRA|nr:hypothetical protein H310_02011 [Aphanomyces invadans]ETW07510.1 hypothetical protein H310_02011 [Aphanomyces invadans]|eukprot:XP_008863603.1 hypothetical protein H310_02011 [Aphanomyces invadans]
MSALPRNHVLQQATYSPDYLTSSLDLGYKEAEEAWFALLQRHRHIYFDTMAPLVQYSVDDKRRRYCSATQLQTAAAAIEGSTLTVMKLQQQLLAAWHRGASLFQATWRGHVARKTMRAAMWAARIKRTEWLFRRAQGIRRLGLARRHRLARQACRHIKGLVVRAHVNAMRIQRLARHYLFHSRRWHAATRLQKWYVHRVRHRNLTTALARLHGFLKRQRRNALLEEYAAAALDARQRQRERAQAVYFSMKPDHVIVHRMVAARKRVVKDTLGTSRPPMAPNSSAHRSRAVLPLPMATNKMMAEALAAQSSIHKRDRRII